MCHVEFKLSTNNGFDVCSKKNRYVQTVWITVRPKLIRISPFINTIYFFGLFHIFSFSEKKYS